MEKTKTMKTLTTVLLAAALLVGASSAQAQMKPVARAGAWVALAGTARDTNRLMCQMTSLGDQARSVQIKWIGGDLGAHIGKPNWKIPMGVQMPMAIRFDQEAPFKVVATGVANFPSWIEVQISADNAQRFLDQFASADKMHVTFQSGNEREWTLSMDGSDMVVQKFNECVAALKKKLGPTTQPFDADQPPQMKKKPQAEQL
jgi:hypothetical protein